MPSELAGIGENVFKREIVKGSGGGGVSIVVDTGAGEPANEEAGDGTDEPGVEPERWFGEMFATYCYIYNSGSEKSERSDSGGHTKDESGDEHNYDKEERMLGGSWASNKMEIRDAEKECDKGERNIIMNHGEFVVESTPERSDNECGEEATKN